MYAIAVQVAANLQILCQRDVWERSWKNLLKT